MIITYDPRNIKVAFEKHDWNTGLARKAIEEIKTMGGRRYDSVDKSWTIPFGEGWLQHLKDLRKMYSKNDDHLYSIEPEDFDTEEWADEVFGKREDVELC